MDNREGGGAKLATVHPFAPIVVNKTAQPLHRALKVVSFNAQGGRGLTGIVQRLTKPPLAGADVIFLCEADWRFFRSGGVELASELAEALNMSFAFLPQFGGRVNPDQTRSYTGNAILSRQPLHDAYPTPIPNRFLHRRLVRLEGGPVGMVAQIRLPQRELHIGVIHLNSRWDPEGRGWQMEEYLAKLPRSGPMIIGGDFNTTTIKLHGRHALGKGMLALLMQPRRLSDPRPFEPLFQKLQEAGFDVESCNVRGKRTFTPSRLWPTVLRPNLDWIAVRGLEPVYRSARVIRAQTSFFAPRFSDHDFISCEFVI
jgi:endonuclease/exonuclease/phosphatase family metal-dependent hydrolase